MSMTNGNSPDPTAMVEAVRFHAGQEIARLLAELGARDLLIGQLQAELEEYRQKELNMKAPTTE